MEIVWVESFAVPWGVLRRNRKGRDMDKRKRRILEASGLAAGAAMGIAYGGVTKYFVDLAMNRELPWHGAGAERHLGGGAGRGDAWKDIAAAADKLRNSGCVTAEITGHDGTRLMGHWQPCVHGRRVIIAMHGWRSSWANDFGPVADFWRRNGCSVLYAEQRGQGRSGGDYMGFGLMERFDCLAWARWVNRTLTARLPVYLAGVSMGASTVLLAAGLKLPENVRGILADSGYTSPDAIWRHVARRNLHVSYSVHRAAIHAMCRRRIHVGVDTDTCPKALARSTVPVLFVHGTDDHFVPVEMTYENYKACRAPKRLLIVPGAEHGMSYLVNRAEYEKTVLDFWRSFDFPLKGS